jgi:hypothetical protein
MMLMFRLAFLVTRITGVTLLSAPLHRQRALNWYLLLLIPSYEHALGRAVLGGSMLLLEMINVVLHRSYV